MSKLYMPTSPGCFGCGQNISHGIRMQIYIEDGKSKVDLVTDQKFRGYEKIMHGGIIFSMLDEVMAWAPTYAKRQMCLAADVTIRYSHPIPLGIPITIEGVFTNDRKRIWDTKGKIYGDDGKVYAKASGRYIPISMEETLKADEKMVYPEGMKSIFR